jgi:hypothetical protein
MTAHSTLPLRRVIVESPYAGQVERNVAYARAAVADCIKRGETPLASHLLFTQPGILDDNIPEQRQAGIDAGLAWHEVADEIVFYTDYGWSGGMWAALRFVEEMNLPHSSRQLYLSSEDPRMRLTLADVKGRP